VAGRVGDTHLREEGRSALKLRPVRAVVVGAALIAATGVLEAPGDASSSQATAPQSSTARNSFSGVRDSLRKTADVSIGAFQSGAMSVEVALAPSHPTELQGLLSSLYNSHSRSYQHWLKKGEFDSRFAPSRAEVSGVAGFLKASGLVVERSSSPFLLRATGSSRRISAAFRTRLRVYRDARGTAYFSNASAVQLPTSLVSGVLGVIGLSDTVRLHPLAPSAVTHSLPASARSTKHSDSAPSCESGYPTTSELFSYVNFGTPYPAVAYGGSPGCNGLTPSQTNSIYSAPNVGPRGKGAGINLAVFEESAYQHSDIDNWAHAFYGPRYTPPLVDINVDGGPLNPVCPTGDTCPPQYNGYSSAFEVDGDIEMQLTISPDASHILVYNAPEDYTGQTNLDEYTKIANDDTASVVTSSYVSCEIDDPAAYVQAENVLFEQMALQGQSMFAASGDNGAFGVAFACAPAGVVNVLDPAAQPWVTSVGGTSLESDNPGTNPDPAYPTGVETVWNTDNLCNQSANEGGVPGGDSGYPLSGLFWCSYTGAGGGGSSAFWGRPFYQRGPGVNNPYTTYRNGATQCSLAATGTPCREIPDVSANADSYTGYAVYCTANAATPNSDCEFTADDTPPGWYEAGGTSFSSPLWSGIIADRDSFQGHRTGNANPLLYLLFNIVPNVYFHDITGTDQTTNNNGLFPTTPGYDEATGIGTPRMAAIITASG
jgi:subtilase family serine protease